MDKLNDGFNRSWVKNEKTIDICKFIRNLDPSIALIDCKHLCDFILGRGTPKAPKKTVTEFVQACIRKDHSYIRGLIDDISVYK